MKILRIKLTNLNSLRGEHVVNFEAAPLAGAGLFAITGPTGAGKSTLLDAVTLALYGRAARYADNSNPEDMMSRHCGECQAEVEFEVALGRYRAEWQLHRARGKADGKIQAPKRYVYDATGQVLAQSIREAEEQIEKLVGLDYSRFLRSVLLAQGEFARFLKANPDERAALLESLTGTTIYSQLSILAHGETTRREGDLQTKEQALGQIVLLTDEQKQEREQQIERQSTELNKQKAALIVLHTQLVRASELKKALSNQSELLRQQEVLTLKRRDAEPDFHRLSQHRLTIPYADDLGRMEAAIEGSTELRRKLGSAETEQQQAHVEWLIGIFAASEFVQSLIAQQEQALAELAGKTRSSEALIQENTEWLATHSEDKNLEAQLPELVTQLNRLQTFRQDGATAKSKSVILTGKIETQKQAVVDTEKAVAATRLLLQGKESEKAASESTRGKLLAGKTEAAREKQVEELRVQVEAVGKLLDLEESCAQHRKTIGQNQKKLGRLKSKLIADQATAKELVVKKKAASTKLTLAQDHLQKAQLVASLEDHRFQLTPGESCPLCGATDHPFADKNQKAFSLTVLKGEVGKARVALDDAESKLEKSQEAVTVLKADQVSLAGTIKDSETELKKTEKRAKALAQEHRITAANSEALTGEKTEKTALIRQLQDELTRIKKANGLVADHETARLRAESATKLAQEKRTTERSILQQLQEQLKDQNETVAGLAAQLASTSDILTRLLKPYKLSVPDPGHEMSTRNSFQQRKNDHQNRVKTLHDATSNLEQSKSAADQSKKSLADLQKKAGPFLAGRSAHETEATWAKPLLRQQLRASWRDLEQAENALQTFGNRKSITGSAALQLRQEFAAAAQKVADLQAKLATRLAGTPFASHEDLRSAKLDISEAGRLQKLEDSFKSQSDTLKGAFEPVKNTIAELRASGAAEGDAVGGLQTNLQTAQNSHDEIVGHIGRLKDELQRDQAARAKHAAKAVELENERKRLQVWRHLQGLIGSHDGRKFRRYAQGISLNILVCHANEHLQRLTDRYRMQRCIGEELELEIEDLYQAGATRPMASLSGGESFLASLALALGLADLAGRNVRIDSLFIDEGFGSLDADTLDLAISALETLRQDSKTVGIISHVDLLKERISTQIVIEKQPGGTSVIRLTS